MGRLRIGTSGWTYPEWRGVFYPPGLAQRRELEHLADRLPTVELNASFYALQRPGNYPSWARRTPPDFCFSVKGWRAVTHEHRLVDVQDALAAFFASGVLELGEKLGPVLWQLPPSLRFDAEVLARFCALLPSTTTTAAELAASRAAALDDWAQRVRAWSAGGRDVFVYFDNTMAGRAPFDALALAQRLGR
ncbi:DUF72 domain-containing protein [Kineococcus arenarius]|uniref:DUF72 domain-containing protein n=1 Tax=unclassified Kineococcus TaxID=2621656 RepID=UPI003D7DC9D3